MQTTIQDLGRIGWQEYGVPESGAMDKKSLRLANFLVSNPEDNPCIEITIIGPEIHFNQPAVIAVTGADLSAKVNGELIPLNEPVPLKEDDILTFGRCKSGCRAYLAVHGTWQVPPWLESRSTVPYAGAHAGLPPILNKGDQIQIHYDRLPDKEFEIQVLPVHRNRFRVIPGPEFDHFSPESQNALIQTEYHISGESNRMGYRLEEKLPGALPQNELISSGTVPGTIQVTKSGQIILLMADAQTTGGYPRLGVVVSEDLDSLGQKKPGDPIGFEYVLGQ